MAVRHPLRVLSHQKGPFSGKFGTGEFGAGEILDDLKAAARKQSAELDAREKNKVYIVTSLLSQETGKAAFDGQFMAFDPDNFFQPIVTGSDQDADEREFRRTQMKNLIVNGTVTHAAGGNPLTTLSLPPLWDRNQSCRHVNGMVVK